MIRLNLSPKWTKRVKPRAMGPRAREVVDFVRAEPGCTSFQAAKKLLTADDMDAPNTRPFKRAQSAVARVIRDRLVLYAKDRLWPWDRTAFFAAQRAERAAKEPDARYAAAEMWRRAGDENRAQILERLAQSSE